MKLGVPVSSAVTEIGWSQLDVPITDPKGVPCAYDGAIGYSVISSGLAQSSLRARLGPAPSAQGAAHPLISEPIAS